MAYQPPYQGRWEQHGDSFPSEASDDDSTPPPPPPAHRHPVGMHSDSQYHQMQTQRQHQDPNNYSDLSTPGVTPNSDNRSEHSTGRGLNGIPAPGRPMGVPEQSPYATPFNDQYAYESPMQPRAMYSQRSYGSNAPGAGPSAGMYSSSSSMHSMSSPAPPQGVPYSDSPYNRYSSSAQNLAPQMGQINPNELADDDDWGMGPNSPQNKRRSFVPFGHGGSRDGSRNGSPGSSINGAGGAAAAAAAAGTAAYAATRDGNGKYNAVPTVNGSQELIQEKADWKAKDDVRKRKKRMWIAVAVIAIILLGAILGGVLGAMLNRGGGHDGQHGSTASADDVTADNKDDLGKNSAEIKALMSNPNLHKVFPGMDYTPLNSQFPDCLTVGPSQNNITRDMAVMSQLTNAVRLYGTDCNQTEMLIHAIDRLEIKDTMKLWLGVWLDSNDTTTERQIAQTWKILDDYGCDYFKGIIIGNEVLYRKDLTATELLGHITDFRQNITDHKCKLPVAMADLGDNWTADMATKVDYVMSNVHPFFAGVDVSIAAGWTWNFWQDHDVVLTAGNTKIKQVVAEVGWPSGGGKNCGSSPTCTSSTPGSVAGVDELNQFMEDWICPSMKNGTEYFWFSAFDEPWKIRYNEKGKEWEDKWGLMDVNRKLKPGVKIPDCGGQALPSFD
ncbi:glycoside hydrolase superfamily [Pyrenochaeta sp. MPI-SDFR-AT-0127]|nr:glycoside hydrolase superfamily [Pyrenochaeta sp. MPI-SDFR-AT-0127]